MGPAAVLATVGIGTVLGRAVLGALSGSRAAARRAGRGERNAEVRARKAAKRAQSLTERLKSAAETANKQAAPVVVKDFPVPPRPSEPARPSKPLYEVKLEDAVIAPKASKKQVAEAFRGYVAREIHEGRSSGLGTKGNPNARVAQGQRDMGRLKVDGIYGDKTRSRGKELTGTSWPARAAAPVVRVVPTAPPVAQRPAGPAALPPPPPIERAPTATASTKSERPAPAPAAARTPVQAANELFVFATDAIKARKGELLGAKNKPSPAVALAQRDMGQIAVDGQYGPATRARGKALIGKTFPGRVG